MADTKEIRPLAKHMYLTYEEVQHYFPGAIDKLKEDYQFSLDEDPKGFEDQFEVTTTQELVETVIDFYTVVKDRPYINVPHSFTVGFCEPNLGTNVESVWLGDEWEA